MKKKDIWSSQYPFESRYFNLGGLRMHYLDEQKGQHPGDPARDVLLMVHGNPTWSFFFRRILTSFRETHRAVAVDHIGCGLSEKPDSSRYSFRLEQRIEDLCDLIESLDLKKITLIAHDWGGAIGMGAATRVPERFERLILMNTAAYPSRRFPLRIRICRMPFLGRFAIQGLNLFSLAALKMASAHPKRISKAARAGLLAPYDNWAHRTAVYRFICDIPQNEKHPTYKVLEDIEEKLPLFRNKPVCLIWGMLDWCFSPEFLSRFLQEFPEAQVHRLEQAGHYLLEDEPETVIAAIREFLEKQGDSAK